MENNLFLKMKPWHLFMAVMGIPMLIQLVFGGSFVRMDFWIVKMVIIGTVVLSFLIHQFWVYSIATAFHRFLPEDVHVPMGLFKVCAILPSLAALGGFIVMLFIPGFHTDSVLADMNYGLFILFTVLLLAGVGCMLYAMSVSAKVLKAVYSKEKLERESYTIEFFMMILFPVGLWMVQSKVNKVYQRHLSTDHVVLA